MVTKDCPKCGKENSLKFFIRQGYGISFDLKESNETIICSNCKRRISYSVQPIASNESK